MKRLYRDKSRLITIKSDCVKSRNMLYYFKIEIVQKILSHAKVQSLKLEILKVFLAHLQNFLMPRKMEFLQKKSIACEGVENILLQVKLPEPKTKMVLYS